MGTKYFSIGTHNLGNVNFENLGSHVKCIDTIEYYQRNLAATEKSANVKEKNAIKQETEKFTNKHF